MTLNELRRSKVNSMTLAAMLIAVGVLMTALLSFYIPLFGYPSVKIDLVSVVILIGGILLGPLYGAVIGVSIDLLGYTLTSMAWAAYLPGLAINKALIGIIGGISASLFLSSTPKQWLKIVDFILPIVFGVGAIAYVLLTAQVTANGQTIVLTTEIKTILISIIALVTTVFVGGLLVIRKKPIASDPMLYAAIFITLSIELLIDVLLSPYWLAPITGVPYLIGAFTRVFRTVIIAPFKVVLLMVLLRFAKQSIHS